MQEAAIDAVGGPLADRATALVTFLNLYRGFAEANVKDFFLHDAWSSQLPAAWRPHLDVLSMDELATILCNPTPPLAGRSGVWPLSLLCFFAAAHALRLPNQLAPRGGAVDGLEAAEDAHVGEVGLRAARERARAHALAQPLIDAADDGFALVVDAVPARARACGEGGAKWWGW